jgi:GT2 family glycosyltransferase
VTHISIIIVNYNTKRETLACLNSLTKLKTNGFEYAIVVVDNGSREVLVIPDKLKQKNIHLIRSESNLGFTGGNNLGIYHAIEHFNSEYIALLNNDTLVDPYYLQRLHEYLVERPRVGIVSSKIYFSPGTEYHKKSYTPAVRGKVLWYAGGSIDWQNLAAFHRGVDEVDRGHFDVAGETDFATGCSLLIKREVLEKAGLLDKRFFLYFEDTDLSLRAKKQGYEVHYCPTSVVWHKNAGSSGGSGSALQEYYQNRNLLLFVLKHGDWRAYWHGLRLILHYLLRGSRNQRLSVVHALSGRFGKQPLV